MTTPPEPLDLAGPIRLAILADADITALLGVWNSEPAVFTRRPTPENAPYPMAIVSPDISIGNQDMLRTQVMVVRRDVSVYGEQPRDYRTVEALAYKLKTLFHRNKFSIDVSPGFQLIDIVADGPIPAPSDSKDLVGRMVLLRLRLRDLAT